MNPSRFLHCLRATIASPEILLSLVLAVGVAGCARPKKGGGVSAPEEESLTTSPLPSRGDFNPESDVNYAPLHAETVYFAFDSSAIPSGERGKLEKAAQWMAENPERSLLLAGHCDERGTEEYNRGLGERRALAVREYLIGLGVSPQRLHTISYGKDRPATPGHTEADYARNRRVELGVIEK
ncbi:Outer membrane lipoprotein Omp16 [Methylacidimicrobium cyclopophantes]|uniref:Peptidoglycan-associated lipoprotein n=1 Tax=Methylacidimicrobium cyclopophantes TaxID=1041766 RepID=A0A5E6M761_9BACT|nr:OmpA family protein [Methylacidimicrobium cyclopophantes]VVM05151.1 Outer membrane lipoprotein Omp16 [Methylacidimicrobium cyclopophantes]